MANPYLDIIKESKKSPTINPYLKKRDDDKPFVRLRSPKESYELLKKLWGNPYKRTFEVIGSEFIEGAKDIGEAIREDSEVEKGRPITTPMGTYDTKGLLAGGKAALGGLRSMWSPVTGVARAWLGEPAEKLAKEAKVPDVDVKIPFTEKQVTIPTAEAIGIGAELAPQLLAPTGVARGLLGKTPKVTSAVTQTVKQPKAVREVIKELGRAKTLGREQKALTHAERIQRASQLEAIGKKIGGIRGYYAKLKAMKGEMSKVQFKSIFKKLSQNDKEDLFRMIDNSDNLLPFEKLSAQNGMAKLLGMKVRRGGSVPTDSELAHLAEVFPEEFISTVLKHRSTMQKIMSTTDDAINIPRALMATMDLSAPLRQGVFLIGTPKRFIPAFGNMFKYAFHPKSYTKLMDDIKSRPTYELMRESGLSITEMGKNLTRREERFRSELAERIPVWGRVVKGSNRAYTGFLNKLRTDVFDDLLKKAKKLGIDTELEKVPVVAKKRLAIKGIDDINVGSRIATKDGKKIGTITSIKDGRVKVRFYGKSGVLGGSRTFSLDKAVENFRLASQREIIGSAASVVHDIARFVNSATGRGRLWAPVENAAGVLNATFFSPKLMASRLNLLSPRYYYRLDPFVRKEALKSLLTFASTGMSVLGLAKLGGADVNLDPRNANFGKIKIGNTRFDPWGGFQQYMRLAGQLITGKLISSTTGREYTLGEGYKPLTRKDILLRFIESKEAPIVSFASQLLAGQSAIGEPFDVPAQAINRFIPMVAQDMYDLYKEGGLEEAIMAGPAIFGVGVQTYGRQIPYTELTPSGKRTVRLKPVPGIGEDIMGMVRGDEVSDIPEDLWELKTEQKEREREIRYMSEQRKKQLIKDREEIKKTQGRKTNPYMKLIQE